VRGGRTNVHKGKEEEEEEKKKGYHKNQLSYEKHR